MVIVRCEVENPSVKRKVSLAVLKDSCVMSPSCPHKGHVLP